MSPDQMGGVHAKAGEAVRVTSNEEPSAGNQRQPPLEPDQQLAEATPMVASGVSSRRWRPMIWIVVVIGVVGVVVWQASVWTPAPANDQAGGAAIQYGDATGLTVYPVDERLPAPDLEGVTLDGENLALADLSGHVVVLNVWGSWCSPCRAEAPDLARLARETASQGVRFVGIDTRDTAAAAEAFVRTFDIPYPSLVDPDGQLLLQFEGIIPITAVPSTLVIDRQGNIAAKVVGKVTYGTLRGLIEDELAGNTGKPSEPVSRGGS